jgi:hypothetical protein
MKEAFGQGIIRLMRSFIGRQSQKLQIHLLKLLMMKISFTKITSSIVNCVFTSTLKKENLVIRE